jgi:nucleotide-binding universal stress UspA family protein
MSITKTYIVAVDGKPAARRALELAAGQAKANGAKLLILHVIDWSGYDPIPVPELANRHRQREKELADAQKLTDPLAVWAQGAGVEVEVRNAFGQPARTILDVAEETDAQHLFLGRHNSAKITDILLGNITNDVIRGAKTPVTVVP